MKDNDQTLDFEDETVKKIVKETAQIPWKELQRFFASGKVIEVNTELDLILVAKKFSEDSAADIQQWMEQGQVKKLSDETALEWIESDETVWASVIAPWVLVQEITDK